MPNHLPSEIIIDDQPGALFLKEFALQHRIYTLEELLKLPLSAMWQMGGFTMHAQNEIIDLVRKYNLHDQLRET